MMWSLSRPGEFFATGNCSPATEARVSRTSRIIASFALLIAGIGNAYATISPCYQWTGAAGGISPAPREPTVWVTSGDSAMSDLLAFVNSYPNAGYYYGGSSACAASESNNFSCAPLTGVLSGTFPWGYYVILYSEITNLQTHQTTNTRLDARSISYQRNPNGCQVYVSAQVQQAAQYGLCCNSVGDPINPASGSMYRAETDLKSQSDPLRFERFYDSTSGAIGALGVGWRYSYSRSVKPRYGGTDYAGPYVASVYTSSLYNDEGTACTSGFAQIKAQVSSWANATASYANYVCTIYIGSTAIGTLRILYTSQPTPDPSTEPLIGYDSTRDDGQVVSFLIQGGGPVAPPGINLRLQATQGGFTLTDDNDNVESYDATGRLLSITTRAGIVQTLSYDGSGRLISVVDSFGHSLTFSYDTQNRLSTVTRQ